MREVTGSSPVVPTIEKGRFCITCLFPFYPITDNFFFAGNFNHSITQSPLTVFPVSSIISRLAEMAERLKAHDWKSCDGETRSEVRILFSAPRATRLNFLGSSEFSFISSRVLAFSISLNCFLESLLVSLSFEL